MRECASSALDFWAESDYQTAVVHSQYVESRSTAEVSTDGPLYFHVSSDQHSFIDLSKSYVVASVKLKPNVSDGTVAPANMPGYLLFDTVDVKANGTKLSTSGLPYAYKNALQDILSFSDQHKKTISNINGFAADTADEFDSTVDKEVGKADKYPNKGYKKRYEMFKNGKKVDLIGRIGVEIASGDRYIPPFVDLDFIFVKNPASFYLMSKENNPNHKLELTDLYLLIRRVRTSDAFMQHFNKMLLQKPAVFPYKCSTLLTRTISQGQKNLNEPNLFFDTIPSKLVMALVEEDAFSGNIKKNPLKFNHYKMDTIEIYVNNYPLSYLPLRFDQHSSRAYIMSMEAAGHSISQVSNGITPEMFAGGYTLLCFDLRPESTDCFSPTVKGTLQLKLTFKEALPHNVVLMIYGEDDDHFMVTHDHRVLTSLHA